MEEIKAHPFFAGVIWDKIRETNPPIVPELKDGYDTIYFDVFEEEHDAVRELSIHLYIYICIYPISWI